MVVNSFVFVQDFETNYESDDPSEDKNQIEYTLKIGDGAKLWVRPDTNNVYAYALGSVGGFGRIGVFEDVNRECYEYIQEKRKYSARIIDIDSQLITIEVTFNELPDSFTFKPNIQRNNVGCSFLVIILLIGVLVKTYV